MTAVLEPANVTPAPPIPSPGRLVDKFALGLDAPICLTWELTYACNLACVHCLSSSGRRDPRELTTAEAEAVIDELERMQVFYVNIGGGEPTVRPDFWHLVDYATEHHVGVKFSTNGVRITPEVAQRLAGSDYVDVQISLDGATAEVNDYVRGEGSYATAMRAMQNMADAGFTGFKLSVVVTRQNVGQLDEFKAIADRYGAQLRLTRLRPSGRGADVWDELHLLAPQQKQLYDWLVANGDQVLTGDSFFHLAAFGGALPGLNLCGAGRVVCLIDPVGDVYACPFAIHDEFLAGNVRDEGGFKQVWQKSELFQELRQPQSGGACSSCQFFDSCRGGCMAAKFFTGLPLDGPDPECVRGFGEAALGAVEGEIPKPSLDHSHKNPLRSQKSSQKNKPVALKLGVRPVAGLVSAPPARGCDENPLAGFSPAGLENEDPSDVTEIPDVARTRDRVAKHLVGREHELELVLSAVAAGRDIVLEGPPGTGKTTLLRAIADEWGIPLFYVEGNADLTPAKLVGHHNPARVLKEDYSQDNFVPGPLLEAMQQGGFLYLEEFNRAPDDTLNTLLAALAERRVTVPRAGQVVAQPTFRLIASMNPYDNVGTTRLSTSITDRLCRLSVDYQDEAAEIGIVGLRTGRGGELGALLVADAVWVNRATRRHPDLRQGSSVRGAIDVVLVANQLAALRGVTEAPDSRTRLDPESAYPRVILDAMTVALSGRIHLDEAADTTPERVLRQIWEDRFILSPAAAQPG